MKILSVALALAFFQNIAFSQADTFRNSPWSSTRYPIVIDPYEKNLINFKKLTSDPRIIAIIHKSSQGLSRDSKYVERGRICNRYGLLYGSYHLANNQDAIKQADFFLDVIKDHLDEPIALDIENFHENPERKPFITLENAEKFIHRIYEKTGKYPIIYINNHVFEEINNKYDQNSIYSKCPLWYARFKTKLPLLNKKIWKKVELWQFSSEINCSKNSTCLYNPPGTRFDIDVNVYNGEAKDLRRFWNSYAKSSKF